MKNYKTKPLPVQNVSVQEMQNSIGGIQNKLFQAAVAAAGEMGDSLGGGGGGFANSSTYGYYTPEILVEAKRLGFLENLHGLDSVKLEIVRSRATADEAGKMIESYYLKKLLDRIF
jgi:hypothetical protein